MALIIIINSAIVRLGGVNIRSPFGKCELYTSSPPVTSQGPSRERFSTSAMLRPVARTFLIDTDTASDDAVALIMALRAPDVRVAAITIVAGNVDVQQATRNALYTVELCGAKVPVYSGAEKT